MIDDPPSHPRLFANHVISQIVEHMVGSDMVVEGRDFMAMRIAFRKLGGVWESLLHGDIEQLDLLKKVVAAWAQMPGRERLGDEII